MNISSFLNEIHYEDSLKMLEKIPSESVDFLLTDPPYLTTDCKFDKQKYDWAEYWNQWRRVIKTNGVIAIFGQMPFSTIITSYGLDIYRHRFIWQKDKCGNFLVAKGQPLKYTEDIFVFSKSGFLTSNNSKNQVIATYNPQFREGSGKARGTDSQRFGLSITQISDRKTYQPLKADKKTDGLVRYPQDIIYFPVTDFSKDVRIHPTQKPVDLFRYLIRTYSNENDTILDCFSGSGTTAVACILENRNFICCENDFGYLEKSKKRIELLQAQPLLFNQ